MTNNFKTYKTVLTIAGSDSSGGAGIQADIKTCSALGVYAMSVITAVTAQNTTGVTMYEAVSPDLLRAQLEAVLSDIKPDAVKIGMIPDVKSVEIIAEMLTKYHLTNVVLDPVAVATSGDSLSDSEAPRAIANLLFGLSTVITPNIPETELYLETKVDKADISTSARDFINKFDANAVLIKGGHSDRRDSMVDILMVKNVQKPIPFSSDYVNTENSHGTGCSLSSAIASYLALGYDLESAIKSAKQFLYEALLSGSEYKLGHGHGPINHLYRIIK